MLDRCLALDGRHSERRQSIASPPSKWQSWTRIPFLQSLPASSLLPQLHQQTPDTERPPTADRESTGLGLQVSALLCGPGDGERVEGSGSTARGTWSHSAFSFIASQDTLSRADSRHRAPPRG